MTPEGRSNEDVPGRPGVLRYGAPRAQYTLTVYGKGA